MRDGRHILDGSHADSRASQGSDRTFSARSWALHQNRDGSYSVVLSSSCRILSSHLCCKRSALSRTLKTFGATRTPGDRISSGIGNRNHRIVKRRIDVSNAHWNVLSIFLLCSDNCCFFFSHFLLTILGRIKLSSLLLQPSDEDLSESVHSCWFFVHGQAETSDAAGLDRCRDPSSA